MDSSGLVGVSIQIIAVSAVTAARTLRQVGQRYRCVVHTPLPEHLSMSRKVPP